MTRQEYIDALRRSAYLEDPTTEQMAAICPHLDPEQALLALRTTAHRGGSIALPPVLVRGAVRLVSYFKNDHDPMQPAMLYGGRYVYRGRESFADGKSHGGSDINYRFADEAREYAEEHWGSDLVEDDWPDVQVTHLQVPFEVDDVEGEPLPAARNVRIVTSSLGLKWSEIRDDPAIPAPDLWNEAIITMTTDPIMSAEIRRPRYNNFTYNCACCGGALDLEKCTGCHIRLPYDHSRSAWSSPLPPKIIKLLRDEGHQFELDPERLLGLDRPVS